MKIQILFVRVFGIGNAVLSIPAIKCYRDAGCDVTVLVGSTKDDFGANQVLSRLPGVRVVGDQPGLIRFEDFDHIVLSMPYDGRYGTEANTNFPCEVHDGRPRPDPSTFGFSSWKKHEAKYQLEIAKEITGNVDALARTGTRYPINPGDLDTSFWNESVTAGDFVYLGIGRKYDDAGFWDKKHWGDSNFIELAEMILERHPEKKIVCTGGLKDTTGTGRVLIDALSKHKERFKFAMHTDIQNSFRTIAACHSYVGNDTGMMHVAASMNKPVVAVFNFENTIVKNHPLCEKWRVLQGHDEPVEVDLVYNSWKELIDG